MTNAFNPFLRVVSNMMARFGGDGTLEITAAGPYDKATSEATTVITKHSLRGLMFDYIPRNDGMSTEIRTLIRTGDKQLFVKPNPLVPAPKAGADAIVFGGVRYAVIAVKELNTSGSVPIYYECYLRE